MQCLAFQVPHCLRTAASAGSANLSAGQADGPMRKSAVFWPALPLKPLPLVPLAERILEMRARLAQAGPGPSLGLTWRGGTPPREQRAVIWVLHKEIGIALLATALHSIPGTFIALQRNPAARLKSNRWRMRSRRPVHDFPDLNEDLEGMLALMALLDDYIGVSNTNMHLRAGAGKTARVLVPSPPDWRWMMNHSRTLVRVVPGIFGLSPVGRRATGIPRSVLPNSIGIWRNAIERLPT